MTNKYTGNFHIMALNLFVFKMYLHTWNILAQLFPHGEYNAVMFNSSYLHETNLWFTMAKFLFPLFPLPPSFMSLSSFLPSLFLLFTFLFPKCMSTGLRDLISKCQTKQTKPIYKLRDCLIFWPLCLLLSL